MTTKTYMERLEDILDAMGLRTFDESMKLEYRFGSFDCTEGMFRLFVYEDDILQMSNYMELRGDHTFWIALEYPGFDPVFDTIKIIGDKCWRVLGKQHITTFILALEEGLDPTERKRLELAFNQYGEQQRPGTYYDLRVWDNNELNQLEQEHLKPSQSE